MKLLTESIWQFIADKAEHEEGQVRVVVAYATENRAGLQKGDLLVCDASEKAIRSGATSASLLRKLFDEEVEVYSCPSLHAKIVCFSDAFVLGSMNMTRNTEHLVEMAAYIDSKKEHAEICKQIDKIVNAPETKKVTKELLETLLSIEVIQDRGDGLERVESERVWVAGSIEMSDADRRHFDEILLDLEAGYVPEDNSYVFSREKVAEGLKINDIYLSIYDDGCLAVDLLKGMILTPDTSGNEGVLLVSKPVELDISEELPKILEFLESKLKGGVEVSTLGIHRLNRYLEDKIRSLVIE